MSVAGEFGGTSARTERHRRKSPAAAPGVIPIRIPEPAATSCAPLAVPQPGRESRPATALPVDPHREFRRARQAPAASRHGKAPPLNSDAIPAAPLQSAHLLAAMHPELSAATPIWRWQKVALILFAAAVLMALVAAPRHLAITATVLLAPPFFSVFLLRLLAIVALFRPDTGNAQVAVLRTDAAAAGEPLPTYAVLVPLYDEAAIVPALVAAMHALDYPADRLAIRFVVEEDDLRTRKAFEEQSLPAHMQVSVVPPGTPRTKPRACNIALRQTPGQFVVVYDAEDLPEPDQLRRAVAAFAKAPAEVVCLQAALNTFNPNESWLARQFTIEYSALFDLILPALFRFGLPVPLGGTSNHFRRAALEAALAWDPHNVTEDADLGMRLARMGWRVGVLTSTTWEEAPPGWRTWLGQRTRWLKGWMITYLVHTRQPRRLLRELGAWPFVGFQLLMVAMFASALVHPWFYVLLAAEGLSGTMFIQPEGGVALVLWWLMFANLALGYVSAALIGAVAVWRRRRRWLIAHLVLLPLYWLLVSFAAYRALAQLFVAPFHWEKTRHRARLHRKRDMPRTQSQPS